MPNEHSRYKIDGRSIPSVTEILGVVRDPHWEEFLETVGPKLARLKRDKGAAFGTEAHQALQAVCVGQPLELEPHQTSVIEMTNWFKRWSDENIEECLGVETALINETHRYFGRADAIAKMKDGSVKILEFKTGKVFKDVYRLQAMAYLGFERAENYVVEPGEVESCLILKFGAEPKMLDLRFDQREFSVFLSALDLWRWRNAQARIDLTL